MFEGLYISTAQVKELFVFLTQNENSISPELKGLRVSCEKILYDSISIEDMEKLQERIAPALQSRNR